MKKYGLLIIVIFCVISTMSYGQNCKNFKKGIKRAEKHLGDKEYISATKQRRMFSKFSQAVTTYFVKSEANTYLAILFVREMGRRIDLLDKDPIILQFENGELLTLYPEKSSLGKFTLPVTTEINHQFYVVSNDQLKQIASQQIDHVRIYFTSDKVAEQKYSVDDLGAFFDYEILNERYKANLMEPANCMLNN